MERTVPINGKLAQEVYRFVRRDFRPHFGELKSRFPTHPVWKRLAELGTELWLDTGDIAGSAKSWTREFTALTTNNTLLNREVQTGDYDDFIAQAGEILAACPELSDSQRKLEMAFILNARHGLRLVEEFDAFVSVEEHTDLAHDVESAVEYARRYHRICPERFIVKIPLTPAGLLATRKVVRENIPVNHTLGFSARQNYVIARLARPAYVNVFMGRLNSFVADNRLGDGERVGERATLASQKIIRQLRSRYGIASRQIGASFRSGGQVRDLMGIDVMTMPLKVAQEFLDLNLAPDRIADQTGRDYQPVLAKGVDPARIRLGTLWEVEDELVRCVDELEKENLDAFTPDDLMTFFETRGCGDVLVRWTDEEIVRSESEGKIPKLENWREDLSSRRIGLDSLMNLAGLMSFTTDQKAMDERVLSVLSARGSVKNTASHPR